MGVLIDSDTWVTWAELKPLVNQPNWSDHWRLIFSLLEPLAAVCGDEHVRLVIWATS